jgi:rod shape-determining protein MreD
VKRTLAALLASLALVVLQTSGTGGGTIPGVRPDLLLLFVLAAGMRGGEGAGALWGVGLGFAQDTFSAGLPGTGVLTKGLVGLAAGSLREQLDCDNPNTQALVAVVATLADGAAHLALIRVFSEVGGLLGPLLGTVVPAAAVHGALLPAALAARRVLARRLGRRAAAAAP